VSFDRHGNYELRCPELGIELVRTLPPGPSARTGAAVPGAAKQPEGPTEIDPATTDIVLQEGEGTLGVVVGESRFDHAEQRLGEPLDVDRLHSASNHHFPQQITLNIPEGGPVQTIITRPRFGGRTARGIRHGDTRDKVHEVYGRSDRSGSGTATFDGVIFWFDERDRVNRIVIRRKPPPVK
jgi:hypothetical protein